VGYGSEGQRRRVLDAYEEIPFNLLWKMGKVEGYQLELFLVLVAVLTFSLAFFEAGPFHV
jgi:hypothetical protein